METSTKVLLAGLAAFAGLSLYAKKSHDTYNPLALLGHVGPPLPKETPALPPGTATPTPKLSAPPSSSPEVEAAKTALSAIPSSFPNSPEVEAATNALQNAPIGSPEAQAALSLLQGLPNTPESQAALNLLQQAQQSQQAQPPPFVPGVLDEPLVKNGDRVNVDMFRSGMAVPQGVPVVGLIFMTVISLEAGAPDKFVGRFVNPEFQVFGDQVVNRSAIVAKA